MEREVEERFERIEAITARHAEFMARHEEMMVRHEEWLARHEEIMARHAQAVAAHQLAMANLDDHLTKLAAAQIVTEQNLQGLIDALRRSGNGNN